MRMCAEGKREREKVEERAGGGYEVRSGVEGEGDCIF